MDLVDHVEMALSDRGVARGDLLGLAVSGGADSTALMHLAAAAAPPLGLRLHVLHVDHALRAGSVEDAIFVEDRARDLGLRATILRSPVEAKARESLEAAARRTRYAALDGAADELGCRLVATAHTLDDQAETVLLRAMRGSGTGGLAGIAPVRGRFVRPLLGLRRVALRRWLMERGLLWRDDPTNEDLRFERNWVRRIMLPAMEERREGVAATLARLADLTRDDAAALDAIADERFERFARVRDGVLVLSAEALRTHAAIASRVVLRGLTFAGAGAAARTVDQVLHLRSRGVATMPGAGSVWHLDEGIAFVPRERTPPADVPLAERGIAVSREWGLRARVGADERAEAWTWRCKLDAVRGRRLVLRARRPGDRVPTAKGTRKVQDVLVDAKVPRFARDRVPVLAAAAGPVAVVGLTVPPAGEGGEIVVDVEPLGESWWSLASSRATS